MVTVLRTIRLVAHVCALIAASANAAGNGNELVPPDIGPAAKRPITIDDVMALRKMDSLSVSPDGRRFAIFVHQGDTAANRYRTGWFTGEVNGSKLTYAGDGGEIEASDIAIVVKDRESRWSPDGHWIAYLLKRAGEVQLWRSRADGTLQEQVTHNAADVRDFAWSDDGKRLFFKVGMSRAGLKAVDEAKARNGYRYNDDFDGYYDLMDLTPPKTRHEAGLDLTTLAVEATWAVTLDTRNETLATEQEAAQFVRARAGKFGAEAVPGFAEEDIVLQSARPDGAVVRVVHSRPKSMVLRVMFFPAGNQPPLTCTAEQCSGFIQRAWWNRRGNRVLFTREEGVRNSSTAFYSWSPSSGAVSTILRSPDDFFRLCEPAASDRVVCGRENSSRPLHMVTVDLSSGKTRVVAELNPEFRNIELGKVERYEWDLPKLAWNEAGGKLAGIYRQRPYGYIFYPPNFDPNKKYPAVIDPYAAHGFEPSVGSEHSVHLYAANGFIVLNMVFPTVDWERTEALIGPGANIMTPLYREELDFPLLTMLADSTFRGVDTAASRGFVDQRRLGIGGVSHGSFVPMYMVQKYDRIAALSISGPGWSELEYYLSTRRSRPQADPWPIRSVGRNRDYWSRIDLADHVEAIEAPMLIQAADVETLGLLWLMRNMEDEGKPYDPYIFPKETHTKWQPAHLYAVLNRNLDWFRFWLQDYEDPAPAKQEQYQRWRGLRELQCKNSRSVRDYCGAAHRL